MDFAQAQRNPAKHSVGIVIVIVMHVLLVWALFSGLARKVVEVVKAPIETKIIEETKPPPPPPPENLPPPPKNLPPPPAFVPPPEVQVTPPPTPAPTITVTRDVPPPTPVTISAAPPGPPASAPARTAPSLSFNACEKPVYTAAAHKAQVSGTTTVVYTMDVSGKIIDAKVERSSGPTREHKSLDRATVDAILACTGKPGTVEGKPEKLTGRVEYAWKIVD